MIEIAKDVQCCKHKILSRNMCSIIRAREISMEKSVDQTLRVLGKTIIYKKLFIKK